jgi:hypothetical protein
MSGSSSSKEAFQLKLQEATVDVERLGELFLINREQVSCISTVAAEALGLGSHQQQMPSITRKDVLSPERPTMH